MSLIRLQKRAAVLRRAVSSCRIEALEDRRLFAVGSPSMIDIWPGSGGGMSVQSTPGSSAKVGDALLFAASNGTDGAELWRSDGTAAGTYQLKNINPGLPGGSSSSTPSRFVTLNGVAYFTATHSDYGSELWRSDGTADGTYLVKDLNPGTIGASITSLIANGNALYFIGNDGATGAEVYKSDGTAAGTVRLSDITPDGGSSRLSSSPLVASGSNVYFIANDTGAGNRLWKTDGVTTAAVYELSTGIANPISLFDYSGTLVFAAVAPGGTGQQLFRSDGTAAGTYNLTNSIAPTVTASGVSNYAILNGDLFFSGNTASGFELWKSNGTFAGTSQVTDFLAGTPTSTTAFDGRLWFMGSRDGGTAGTELFVSDGTAAGTQLFMDIMLGTPNGSSNARPMAVTPDGRMYFTASDLVAGQEVWVTDGTVANTFRIADINAGTKSASPILVGTLGSAVLFSASNTTNGPELWHVEAPVKPVNAKPTAVITAPTSVDEGTTAVLSGASSSDADGSVVTYQWDLNYDGVTFTADVTGHSTSVALADGPSRTVALRVVDNLGEVGDIATATIAVNNLAPTVSINAAGTVNEGAFTTIGFVLNDASWQTSLGQTGGDTLTYSWTVKNAAGTTVASGNGPQQAITFTPADNGVYTASVTVSDDEGAANTASTNITVGNVAPTLSTSGASGVAEGSTYTLGFARVSDPGADAMTSWTINWGDGTSDTYAVAEGSATHVYADNGSYTITGSASDDDGTYSFSQRTVAVSNVAPTVNISGAATVAEGATYVLNLSAVDPGRDTITSWVIDWGDGTQSSISGNPSTASHVYADGTATRGITAWATDEDGTHISVGGIAPGQPDAPSFGVGGIVSLDLGGFSDEVKAILTQPDGKILAVGWGAANRTVLYRFSADGSMDPDFAFGAARVVFNQSLGDADIKLQADGKILVGYSIARGDGTLDYVVARLLANGNYDLSFGLNGIASAGFSDGQRVAGLVLQADGKIVVGGSRFNGTWQFGLTRFTASGQLDTSFGVNGSVSTAFGSPDAMMYSLTAAPDGKLVAVGYAGNAGNTAIRSMAAVRYTANGALDAGFGNNGIAVISSSQAELRGVAVRADGRIVVAGFWGNRGTVLRLNTNGTLDSSFGTAGMVQFPTSAFTMFNDVTFDSQGRIVVGGLWSSANLATRMIALRYLPDGTPDAAFGPGGYSLVNSAVDGSGNFESYTAITIDGQDRIVFGGSATFQSNADWRLVRLNNGQASQTVTVQNVAPTATLAQSGTAVEGSPATVAFANQSDVPADTAAGFKYSYDFNNDGTYEIVDSAAASATHTFANNGTYTVAARIADKDGGARILTTSVVVANAAPVVSINAPASAVEGNLVQLTANVSDAGTLDSHTYAWTVTKNGVAFASGSTAAFSFTPNDQGTYVASLTVTDNAGAAATAAAKTIAVTNRAPAAVFAATGAINEGSAGTFSFTNISDAAADLSGMRYSFDFNNDGDFTDAGEIANGTAASRTFTWTDNGPRTIRGRITDKDGAFTDYTTTVAVNNVAPTATITGPTTGKKNKAITFTLIATDQSTIDAAGNFTFRIDWDGNGTIDQTVTGRSGMTVQRKYTVAGTFNIRVTATDKDGGLSLLSAPLVVKIT